MATKFDLKQALRARREEVIEKFNALQSEEHYNKCTLKQFMTEFMNLMIINNPRSQKRFDHLFRGLLEMAYYNNCSIVGNDSLTEHLRKRHSDGQWAAII